MAQEPLTSAGVQQKLSDLYDLTDTNLASEAGLIASDFRGWVKDNFVLTTAQSSYLDGIDDDFITLAASNTSFAVKNRLPVAYTPSTKPPGDYSKFIRQNDTLYAVYSSNGGTEGGGSLEFEVYYEQ